MRKVLLGLPIWTPLFILFLLFLAGVWGKPSFGVNRHGLLDSYREQIHGTPLTRKEVECPEDGIKNTKQSRYDRSLNPQDYKSEFDRKLGGMDHDYPDHFKLNADHFNLDADQFNTVSPRLNQNENHFSLDADQFNRDADQLNRYANHFDVDTDNFSQHRDVDMFDNFQVNQPELVNNPMMDYKREFASDEANPYVESLQQRYEPLPHAFKD
ncbi:GM17539 [Drosophila sechellia]|uniref:GM17539 n=1 Tax=Drosophila sechellia TaxID=7238 RepID=B4IHP4_DROSE|nr:GM17539 [Drosophila sechellia]